MKRFFAATIFILILYCMAAAQDIAPISQEAMGIVERQAATAYAAGKGVQIIIAVCIILAGAAGMVKYAKITDEKAGD